MQLVVLLTHTLCNADKLLVHRCWRVMIAPFSRVSVRRPPRGVWLLYLISQSTIAANKRALELNNCVLWLQKMTACSDVGFWSCGLGHRWCVTLNVLHRKIKHTHTHTHRLHAVYWTACSSSDGSSWSFWTQTNFRVVFRHQFYLKLYECNLPDWNMTDETLTDEQVRPSVQTNASWPTSVQTTLF